jgi:DNA-binding transcriptional LysR family regulator
MKTVHELAGVDLNLLVVFQALHTRRSVTRAALDLGLTQSAVSHALGRLRELLGDALFVRDGRGLAPTPRADALIGPVRAALGELSRALAAPVAFDPADSRRVFTLASVDLFDLAILPAITAALRAAAPRAALHVRAHGPASVEALHAGELDAAIHPVLDGPDPLPTAGLMRRTLLREGFVVFTRADHPFDGSLDAYVAADHLVVSPDGAGRSPVDAHLAALGLTRRVAARLPQFAAALALVAATDLVLTAPATLVTLAPPSVRACPPPLDLPGHSVTLVWSARFDDDPAHAWWRQRIADTVHHLRGAPRSG